MSEACQRCGRIDEDCRTIWMACCCEMDEIGLPFTKKILFDAKSENLNIEKEGIGIHVGPNQIATLVPDTVKCSGEMTPIRFYTLRVCKECRSKWLHHQKMWWRCNDENKLDEMNNGYFIRDNGTTKELALEEMIRFEHNKIKLTNFQKMRDKIHRASYLKLIQLRKVLNEQSLIDDYLPGVSVDDCLQEIQKELSTRP
jgi:hypothetical protein